MQMFYFPQSFNLILSLGKNLQGNHEDQWVQQLQQDQLHPKNQR